MSEQPTELTYLYPRKITTPFGDYYVQRVEIFEDSFFLKTTISVEMLGNRETITIKLTVSKWELDNMAFLWQKVEQELIERLTLRTKIAELTRKEPQKVTENVPFGVIRPKIPL